MPAESAAAEQFLCIGCNTPLVHGDLCDKCASNPDWCGHHDDWVQNCGCNDPCTSCGQIHRGDCYADDERREARGTSQCDGLCDPMRDWCLVAHSCPDACGGGKRCPYNGLKDKPGWPAAVPPAGFDDDDPIPF